MAMAFAGPSGPMVAEEQEVQLLLEEVTAEESTVVKRKRARHPAGSEKGGEFVADDPATPKDEAWEG